MEGIKQNFMYLDNLFELLCEIIFYSNVRFE